MRISLKNSLLISFSLILLSSCATKQTLVPISTNKNLVQAKSTTTELTKKGVFEVSLVTNLKAYMKEKFPTNTFDLKAAQVTFSTTKDFKNSETQSLYIPRLSDYDDPIVTYQAYTHEDGSEVFYKLSVLVQLDRDYTKMQRILFDNNGNNYQASVKSL